MFKGGLNFDLAQKIVDNIMTIVPYNINIMDISGTIIASGNPLRINQKHLGAIKALEKKEPYVITEDTEHEKKGINVPFRYHDQIVGVIGVSGEPSKVEEIANIVRVTAELMIEKQFYDNKAFAQETKIRDLFSDIISRPDYLEQSSVLVRAQELELDLTIVRVAVLFRLKDNTLEVMDNIKQSLMKGEHVIRESSFEVAILYNASHHIQERIKKILDANLQIDHAMIGVATTNLYQAFESVQSVSKLANALKLEEKMIRFEDYLLECYALQLKKTEYHQFINHQIMSLSKGEMLKETLIAYIKSSFDIQKTCDHLFIHKNTLYYRLQKLTEISGFNVRNPKESMILYMVLVNSSL